MRTFPSILSTAAATVAGLSFASGAPVSVKIVRVDDNRVSAAHGSSQPGFNAGPMAFSSPAGLTITLHASGPIANSAVSYGKLAISDARDNLGDKLRIAAGSNGFQMPGASKGTHKIQRQPAGFGAPASSGFDVPLRLTEPPRKATQIKLLRGSFRVVAGGKANTVKIDPMKSMGKAVHSPTLTKAGLKIRILKSMPAGSFMPGAANQALILSISGHKTALEKVKILNASGGDISAGSSFGTDQNGPTITSYQLKRALKTGDKVKLIVATGQKTITVPFDLHNVKLP